MRTLLAVLGLALLLPATASAGGWASAGVLNPPENIGPGETWAAQIQILQHGRTPLTGVAPAVIVGGDRFPATPVDGRPGVYTADVVFPRSGRIEYRVDDGFTNVVKHTFVAVVGEPATPVDTGSGFPWLPVIGGALAALAVALLVTRRSRAVTA